MGKHIGKWESNKLFIYLFIIIMIMAARREKDIKFTITTSAIVL